MCRYIYIIIYIYAYTYTYMYRAPQPPQPNQCLHRRYHGLSVRCQVETLAVSQVRAQGVWCQF